MTGLPPSDHHQTASARPLTAEERSNVATGLRRLYPVPTDRAFEYLLIAIRRARSGGGATILDFPGRGRF